MCSRNVLAGFLIAAVLCALSGHVAAQGTWAVEKTFHIGGEGGWDYVTVDARITVCTFPEALTRW